MASSSASTGRLKARSPRSRQSPRFSHECPVWEVRCGNPGVNVFPGKAMRRRRSSTTSRSVNAARGRDGPGVVQRHFPDRTLGDRVRVLVQEGRHVAGSSPVTAELAARDAAIAVITRTGNKQAGSSWHETPPMRGRNSAILLTHPQPDKCGSVYVAPIHVILSEGASFPPRHPERGSGASASKDLPPRRCSARVVALAHPSANHIPCAGRDARPS